MCTADVWRGLLRARGCAVLSSDQRVGVAGGERYVYPDVSVVCGPAALEAGTSDVLILRLSIVMPIVYYVCFELTFQATLGKFFTRTRVVTYRSVC
jgi:hypothetical protein